MDKEEWADAEASLREAIRFDPKCAPAHYNLGLSLEKLGKDADAEASYREAIRLDPKDARIHWSLMLLFEKRGDVDGAIVEMREYIRKGDPDNDGQAELARLLLKKKEDAAP